MNRKSFCNHTHNGVNLKFDNGNQLSTIWGSGSYTENHNAPIEYFSELMPEGSNTVEVMIETDRNTRREINAYLNQPLDNDDVIGHLSITKWLWIVNKLSGLWS